MVGSCQSFALVIEIWLFVFVLLFACVFFCGDFLVEFRDDRKLSIFCCNGRNCLVGVAIMVSTGMKICL